jgi:hypothetical protein
VTKDGSFRARQIGREREKERETTKKMLPLTRLRCFFDCHENVIVLLKRFNCRCSTRACEGIFSSLGVFLLLSVENIEIPRSFGLIRYLHDELHNNRSLLYSSSSGRTQCLTLYYNDIHILSWIYCRMKDFYQTTYRLFK